jgi:pimeloyl-ACP methyl ester carboxylesterase
MPRIKTSTGDELFYRDDDFTAPWEEGPTVLLLHAEAEQSLSWYSWVPRISSRARVIRPDMRGFGRSTALKPGQAWSLDRLTDDVVALLEELEIDGDVHVVGARLAGSVALRLATAQPQWVTTLTLCSALPNPVEAMGERAERWARLIEKEGIEAWAEQEIGARIGDGVRENDLAGWAELTAEADPATFVGLLRSLPAFDATSDLERIECATLVMTTDACPAMPLDSTLLWQRQIPASELRVMNGIGEHVAASHARDAAQAMLDFMRKETQLRAEEAKASRGTRDERERRRELRQQEKVAGREQRRTERRAGRGT